MKKNIAVVVILLLAGLFVSACGNDGLGRIPPVNNCTPNCYDRNCGSDGCNGTCGTCSGDLFCEPMSGLCLGDGKYVVQGTLEYEYMFGDVSSGSVSLDGPDILPAQDLLVTVIDVDGNVIGANFIEGNDGRFSVPVSTRLSGDEKLLFSTVWAPAGKVIMAVLDPETEANDPGAGTYDPFTWVVDIPAGGNVGQILLSIEDNSGALFVFLMNRLSFDSIVQPLIDKNYAGKAKGLAILFGAWDPNFVPCTCYHGEVKSCIGTSRGPCLSTKITLVDSPGDSSAWGWAVHFHEFGHYILDSYSKDNSKGGAHYFGEVYSPEFSFSEGWATFMSLVTATMWFDETWPVYWDIQGGSSFWVDFENGAYYGDSFGTVSMVFPSITASSTQKLDENWVARALYLLWDGSETGSDPDAMLTLEQMTDTVSSDRFLQGFDFALKADLINFLDSAICLYPEKKTALTDRVVNELGFPYHGKPRCTQYASSRPDIKSVIPAPTGPVLNHAPRDDRPSGISRTYGPSRIAIPSVQLFDVTLSSAIHVRSGK